jgi:hypothetical protein
MASPGAWLRENDVLLLEDRIAKILRREFAIRPDKAEKIASRVMSFLARHYWYKQDPKQKIKEWLRR